MSARTPDRRKRVEAPPRLGRCRRDGSRSVQRERRRALVRGARRDHESRGTAWARGGEQHRSGDPRTPRSAARTTPGRRRGRSRPRPTRPVRPPRGFPAPAATPPPRIAPPSSAAPPPGRVSDRRQAPSRPTPSISRPPAGPSGPRAPGSAPPRRGGPSVTASSPARSAIVRATRSSRSVPRPDKPLALGEHDRAGASSPRRAGTPRGVREGDPRVGEVARSVRLARRAAAIRAATGADASGSSGPTRAAGGTRSTATHRSMRSRSGPETRRRYRSGTPGGQVHDRSADPSWPHGHGFIAAMSWNRAGNTSARPTRTTATLPSSSGWRSASRTSRENSGSSSQNSVPGRARVTSPGDSRGPPPTMPA